MIDINFHHADTVVEPFNIDRAEHYQYDKELNELDFKNEVEAIYAIRKWILPNQQWSDIGRHLRKEAFRFCLTLERSLGNNIWLPGIDNDVQINQNTLEIYRRESLRFNIILWKEVFQEPFIKANLKHYRQRVDFGFLEFPDRPTEWGEPEYKPWPFSVTD